MQAGERRRVGKLPFVFFFGDFLADKAPFGVRTARVLNCGIHVDAKTVADTPNSEVLIEAIFVAVFRQNAEIPLAKRHLVVAGGVVGYVSVRDILDVPHNAVEYLGDFHVGFVVGGDDFAARPVLALVVGDLQDVLRQLVDGQARSGVDRLALDATAGRQHVSRPLPLVIWAGSAEAQVVQLILTGIRIRGDRHRQACAHRCQHVAVVAVGLGAARRYCASFVNPRVLIGHYLPFFLPAASRLTE